jgi:DNA-binding response OmpR family regulator
MRVLVVEDHSRLAEAVTGGLREERMAVNVAYDGQDALDHVALTRYHVIVLDQELPGVHGDQVCADLASRRCPRPIALPSRAERHRGPPPSRVPHHP